MSLLRSFVSASESTTEGYSVDHVPDDLSLFYEVRETFNMVNGNDNSKGLPEEPKQLAVGLLSIYRHRNIDFSIREEVMLLHISESSNRMRAHDGQCFVYKDGSLVLFAGVISQGTLQRTRCFMKQLEGIC